MNTPFHLGQTVRIRETYRREGDFNEAVICSIDGVDGTIDVEVDGVDWGQWFCRLDDGTYEIEPVEVVEQADLWDWTTRIAERLDSALYCPRKGARAERVRGALERLAAATERFFGRDDEPFH